MLFFVYGTLLSCKYPGMQRIAEGSTKLGYTYLKDHKLVMDRYPTIIEQEGQSVIGEVWEVPESKLPLVDSYEGYPSYYGRKTATVKVGNEDKSVNVYYMIGHNCPVNIPGNDFRNWGQ